MNGQAALAPVFRKKYFFIGKHLCQITMPPRGREGAVVDGRRGEGATPSHGFMELVRTGRCLLDPSYMDILSDITSRAEEIPLSGNSTFSDNYIDHITFESEE